MKRTVPTAALVAALIALPPLAGCESLPGSRTQQSTAIGAVAGAAGGALIAGEGNRLVGALIGGALGAAGGYLIGSRTEWFGNDEGSAHAVQAVENARLDPATAADAQRASTADLNADGFVTFDEIVAMDAAGFGDDEMLRRLRATGQVFELNASQRDALLEAGVSARVVSEMERIRQDEKLRVLGSAGAR